MTRLCSMFLALLVLPATVAWGQMRTSADVVEVATAWSQDAAAPGEARVLAVVLTMPETFHINPERARLSPEMPSLIPTSIEVTGAAPGLTFGPVQWPEVHEIEVNYTGEPVSLPVFEGRTVAYVPVLVAEDAAAGALPVTLRLRFQACDDKVCFMPATQTLDLSLEVTAPDAAAATSAGAGDATLFADFDATIFEAMRVGEAAMPGEAAAADASASDIAALPVADAPTAAGGLAALGSFAGILALAFLGGALLNVMPCVLPVIPIKIMGLVHAAPEPGRRLRLGLVMSLGVLVFWIGLGVVVAAIAGGISMLFSFWWFNMALGLLIAGLGVGMMGVFSVRLPQWVYAINPRHDSYTGSFGFGVMTAILATPCTGPFMGAAAGVVLSSGPVAAIVVFSAIGLGMALPYLVLAAAPGLVDRLPRTGPASEVVKQVLGLLAIAAGVFFLGTGVNSLISDGTTSVYQWYWWATAAVLVLAGLWLAWRTVRITPSPQRRVTFIAIGVLLAFGSVAFAYDATRPSAIPWVYYSPDRFDAALAEGRTVVVDFTADWCINCKVLERTVLETDRVIAALASSDVVPMKVDLTGDNEAGWAKLASVERVAIPLLVVFAPDGREVFKQEVYTPGQVLAAVEQAKRPAVATRD